MRAVMTVLTVVARRFNTVDDQRVMRTNCAVIGRIA